MQLNAKKRTEFGKRTKKLRRERLIPGVVFAKNTESIPVTLSVTDFVRVYNEVGETNIVDLKIDDKIEKILIKEVQVHPVNSSILHVDFHKVNLKEKISASIPLEIIGEENNPLVKNGTAIPLVLYTEIDIEALPTDLPNVFELDISGLTDMDATLTIADLVYDRSKVEVIGYEEDALVVKLDYAVSEEEEEEELSEEELLEQIEATAETAEDAEDTDEEEAE